MPKTNKQPHLARQAAEINDSTHAVAPQASAALMIILLRTVYPDSNPTVNRFICYFF